MNRESFVAYTNFRVHLSSHKYICLFCVLSQIGLNKFLPYYVLESIKPKNLRKLIQQQYKKVSQTPEKECVLQFLNLVWSFYKYDQEQFKCSIGVR